LVKFIKTSTMIRQLFLYSVLSLLPYLACAQAEKIAGKCGDTLEGEFKSGKETREIEISMEAGDLFEIMVVPVNDELQIRAEMYDADNQLLVNEEPTDLMFSDETVRSVTLTSGEIKSGGNFKIRLFNYAVEPGKAGVFNTYIKCIKSNGDVIKPK